MSMSINGVLPFGWVISKFTFSVEINILDIALSTLIFSGSIGDLAILTKLGTANFCLY